MAETVDARGLSCPIPVIRTKEELDRNHDVELVVLVDDDTAKENVSRLASSYGRVVTVEGNSGEYRLVIAAGGES